MMHAGAYAAAAAAFLLGGTAASAACLPGPSRNCINLDLVPQISEQIVASEPAAPVPKAKPQPAAAQQPYTGPTVGAVPNIRRAPEVGYRWAIN